MGSWLGLSILPPPGLGCEMEAGTLPGFRMAGEGVGEFFDGAFGVGVLGCCG